MGVFHYKAEYIKQDETYIFYKFYPDFISFEAIYGEFQVKLGNWEIAIISGTEIEGKDSFHCNDRPVSALTYKIQKHFEENKELPEEVFYIA